MSMPKKYECSGCNNQFRECTCASIFEDYTVVKVVAFDGEPEFILKTDAMKAVGRYREVIYDMRVWEEESSLDRACEVIVSATPKKGFKWFGLQKKG